MTCPFCDKNVIEKQVIVQTKSEFVLGSIRPATKGQCLVIPKRHVSKITDLTEEEAKHLLATVRKVSEVLSMSLQPDGFNYGFNEGEYAGQTVEHMHFHVMPRYKNDKLPEFHIFHRTKKEDMTPEELEKSVSGLKKLFEGA